MAHLFYLLGTLFMLHKLSIFMNPKLYLKKIRIIKEYNKQIEKVDGDKNILVDPLSITVKEQKNSTNAAVFGIFYFAWMAIGLCFAGQWMVFMYLMIFAALIGYIRERSDKNTNLSLYVIKFGAFISATLIFILVINHFHKII